MAVLDWMSLAERRRRQSLALSTTRFAASFPSY
jgi:hypothetical protein